MDSSLADVGFHEFLGTIALIGAATSGAAIAFRIWIQPSYKAIERAVNAVLEDHALVQRELAQNGGASLVDKVDALASTLRDDQIQDALWREQHLQAHQDMAKGPTSA